MSVSYTHLSLHLQRKRTWQCWTKLHSLRPRPTPTSTEDVVAPVAAGTLTKLTVTADATDRSNLTYTGAGVTVAEPTVSGGVKDTDYTITADSEYKNLVDVGNRTITWTVELKQAGIDKGYTFGEVGAAQETSTTVENVVNIKPYDWAGSLSLIHIYFTSMSGFLSSLV